MDFLTGKSIFDQVERLIKSTDKSLRIAVSYWGKDILKQTGLQKRVEKRPDSVKVICDLASPGCNPEPIEQIKNLGVEVKSLNNFHAKVWIGDSAVIIGSPNFSKNGLGYDEKSLLSNNVEAAVLTQDSVLISRVAAWFEEQLCKSEPVTDKKIREARNRKKLRIDAARKVDQQERKQKHIERKENLKDELQELERLSFQSDQSREIFFQILLTALKKESFVQANDVKSPANSHVSFRSNRNRIRGQQSGIRYFVRVASSGRTCVELNIDNKQLRNRQKKDWNEKKYEEIKHERDVIEQKLGVTLEWDPKPHKLSSSIAAVRPQTIHDEDANPQEILLWIVDKLVAFEETFNQFQGYPG